MSRDHRRLRVFQHAHKLTIAIYKHTRDFPREEWFGIRAQMRRAAVSVTTNLVEGNARGSTKEYCNFLNISRGSAAEVEYLIGLALELELLPPSSSFLRTQAASLIPQLEALIQKMEMLLLQEEAEQKQKRRIRQSRDLS